MCTSTEEIDRINYICTWKIKLSYVSLRETVRTFLYVKWPLNILIAMIFLVEVQSRRIPRCFT
jgi:hypothetical protein